MELAHIQRELTRLRLELRKALGQREPGQCEMSASSAHADVP
jgi:hypothetical protein